MASYPFLKHLAGDQPARTYCEQLKWRFFAALSLHYWRGHSLAHTWASAPITWRGLRRVRRVP
jgi:hypothetical protein